MPDIDPATTLADLVIARPELAAELDRLGLDYCCGGGRSLADSVEHADLDLADVVADLAAVPVGDAAWPTWSDVGELVDWIERTHHVYLRRTLPWLVDLADKVHGVHGVNHPELAEVSVLVRQLATDLEPHLLEEERVLFPMVRELVRQPTGGARSDDRSAVDGATRSGATTPPAPEPAATASTPSDVGALAEPIRVMLAEHDEVGALLARLRERTDGYHVPDDGCRSYRALSTGLADLEADTHRHVHLENNVLLPAVLAAAHDFALLGDQGGVGEEDRAGESAGAGEQGGESPCWAHLLADDEAAAGADRRPSP